MSYSFTVTGSNKSDALNKVGEEFDKVVVTQPVHAKDKDAVIANASAVVGLLLDDPAKDIVVSLTGSVGWNTLVNGDAELTSASVSASAWTQTKSGASA